MDINPEVRDALRLALAAFSGGAVRLIFRPARSLWQGLWLLFGCVACSFYATPPLVRWLGIDPGDSGAVGALAGLLGLSVAEGLLRAIDSFDFRSLIARLLRVHNDGGGK